MSESSPIYRVTIRLTPEVYAQLEAHGRSGKPLAAIVRDALLDYLARQPEQPATAEAAAPLGTAVAAMTARLDALEAQMQALTAQLAAVTATTAERQLEPPRQPRKLTPRQIRALRDKHRRGVSVPALMDEYGISRASVFRYLQSDKR
jgi:response regulator of citrate/malate metabolism